MAINKVVYGNDTLIDLTGDTVTSATMLNGTTAHDASGTAITGSYTPVTPASLTPSNSSPATITSGETYTATAGGKAVESITDITPSNLPTALTANTPVKLTTSGYAIKTYNNIYMPPNSLPILISLDNMYYMTEEQGYVIKDYSAISPSNTSPVSLSNGSMYRALANGYAISSYTDLVPSNSTPVELYGRQIYKMTNGTATQLQGYAIESYSTFVPNRTNRAYDTLGQWMCKIDNRTGYLYGAIPTGRYLFSYTTSPNRDSTSWYTVGFSSASTTVYDADGTSCTVMLDENFAHFADGGEIVVDRACTIYIAGYAWFGRTSSGTAVYSGVRVLKNGTVITGASVSGSSSTTSPSFRRAEASVAVGDVLKIQTKVSSTSSATHKITVNICTD